MSVPVVYNYPIEQRHVLIAALQQYLPTSLPLYRRLQFEHFTPTSAILCTLSPEALTAAPNHNTQQAPDQQPWAAAFIDRGQRPETEVWFFGTWEHVVQQRREEEEGDEWKTRARGLVERLVAEIDLSFGLGGGGGGGGGPSPSLPPPASPDVVSAQDGLGVLDSARSRGSANNVGRGDYEGYLANPNIVLFGSLHESTVKIMNGLGLLPAELVGADIPYRKYHFNLSKSISRDMTLPPDLMWGKLQAEHMELVKSRTQIPRQEKTLRLLPNLAIYPKTSATPIAWSFLGLDASLSSLHVEPDYRGRGLAKGLAAKLFVDGLDAYGKDDRWAHADVATDNTASNRVCKALQGEWSFHVYWVRVDVSKTRH